MTNPTVDAWMHDDDPPEPPENPPPEDMWPAEEPPPLELVDHGDGTTLDAFWDARPVLRHIHDFARARRVAPWAVLGVTLTRVVVATPYVVGLPPIVGGLASLNLFVGLVGDSGSGKGAAAAVAAEAMHVGYIETHTIGSGEGIAHGYMHRTKGGIEWNDENHAVLFDVPEVDVLTALGDRRGATLLPQLRNAWSGERLGFGYADPTKRLMIPAHQYRMGMVVGIQPLRAERLLDDTAGGTPQRFVWLPAADPDAPDQPGPAPEPRHWRFPVPTDGLTHPDSATTWFMPVCDTARTTIDQARLARLRHQAEALDGHALLARLKLAAALALLDEHLEVTDDDWHLAGIIARRSDRTRTTVQATLTRQRQASNRGRADADAERAVVVAERLDDAKTRRVCRTITRHLRQLPADEWLQHNALRKKLAARDRPDFDQALDRLTEAGQLDVDTADRDTAGHGGKGTRYRLKETA